MSFWIGVGFENDLIFSDQLGGWAASILGNGMTAGGLTAICMTAFFESTRPRRRRLETEVNSAAAARIGGFLRAQATRARWSREAAERLWSAGEEALLSLVGGDEEGGRNIEDRLVLMTPEAPAPIENELSLRLLRHFASSVEHQQYHDTDVLTVTVSSDSKEPSAPGAL